MGIFITATLAMVVLGLMFGAGLALASRVFTVETDERVEHILEALPDTNCGACGYGGCMAYAQAVAEEGEKTNLCVPGGAETAGAVARVMGVKPLDASVAERAVVHCQGDVANCGTRCNYRGFENCEAAHLISGGPKACTYGCLGYGSCADACPFDAIAMESGLPVVDAEKCTACGICVDTCPRNLISLLDMKYECYLGCSSRDSGKTVKNTCKVGCITCGVCAKKDPNGAIEIEDGLPVLDFQKAGGDFSTAADVCPMNSFVEENNAGRAGET